MLINHLDFEYLVIQILFWLRVGGRSCLTCLQPTELQPLCILHISYYTVKTRPLTFITDPTNRLRSVCVCVFS